MCTYITGTYANVWVLQLHLYAYAHTVVSMWVCMKYCFLLRCAILSVFVFITVCMLMVMSILMFIFTYVPMYVYMASYDLARHDMA